MTEHVTDHEAIARLVAGYCHRLDDGDWDGFAQLWAEDAELVIGGATTQGRDAVRASVEASQPPERRGRHLTVNLEVDVDGDTARGVCDFMFWVRDGEGRPKLAFLGRYQDRMTRRDGVWRFARREIQFF
jgi:uncharacterized protein (TIGR02246 family)